MKLPSGTALLLAGSGLYWILSSHLIASFSVLAAGVFRDVSLGTTLVLVVGVTFTAAGFWIVHYDLDYLNEILTWRCGWVFTIPIILVVADVFLTLLGLAQGSSIVELNPFVASAVEVGTLALTPLVVSYMALSEGLVLLMLYVGARLFGPSSSRRFIPFSAVCGAASLGPFNNLSILAVSSLGWGSYILGILGASLIAVPVYKAASKGSLKYL